MPLSERGLGAKRKPRPEPGQFGCVTVELPTELELYQFPSRRLFTTWARPKAPPFDTGSASAQWQGLVLRLVGLKLVLRLIRQDEFRRI